MNKAEDESDYKTLTKTVHVCESPLRAPATFVKQMVTDLANSRELTWRLFLRDTSSQFRQTYFGYFWLVAPPLATMSIWVFLRNSGVVNIADTTVPYPAFVLTGLVLWDSFASALQSPLTSVRAASAMMVKIHFPHEAILLAGLGQVLLVVVVRLAMLIGVYYWLGISMTVWMLIVPVGVAAAIALGFMIGMLLLPLGMLYEDVGRGLSMLTTFWFLLTPVVYPPPTEWPSSLIMTLNPVSPLIAFTRDAATTAPPGNPLPFVCVATTSLIGVLVGWALYRIALPHLIARMSA
ncbi:ABC transporter permease [Calycomorphotria hydatis]|uniref:ABC-2 type transporter n=1 Tax=Calycomorphotria hydatis TaxID=2528027 RepID=A0A517TED8_9PLAN|nr:ABC transporter permease [Calycomorphotria hydatis]QDT66732.1 ABC-2 type transporter [Calycomorphotria hydatis]